MTDVSSIGFCSSFQPRWVRSDDRDDDRGPSIADEYLARIGQGKLSLPVAFIQGRIPIEGNSEKAMKLGVILSKLPKMMEKEMVIS